MKKVLSIVLSLTLVIGLSVGLNVVPAKADGVITNATPVEGATVSMLSDNVYDFCANYQKGLVNSKYKKNSNTYYPTPVTFSWDAVGGVDNYVLSISKNKEFNNPLTYSTSSTSLDIDTLEAGQKYYYRVGCVKNGEYYSSGEKSFTTANLPRTMKIDKAYNTRDIGGCYVNGGKQRVLQGKVYRGARLDEISSDGIAKMVNDYGIKTDLDLREASKVPAVSPLGIDTKLINISAPQYLGPPSSSNENGGIDYSPCWPILKKELEVFTDANNYPIYVHCNIGRDRTGTLLYLVEALLGMTEDEIYRDYELSYFAQVSNSNISDPTAFNVKNVDKIAEYLRTFSTGTLQQNTEKYMKECVGLSQTQIDQIKANLLTPIVEPKPIPSNTTVKVVKPGKVKLKSAKNSKKKAIVVKYKKATNAKKYQIWYSTSKKFKKAKIKKTTKLKYTIKKLKKKKTYYVKVRGVNVSGKTEVYGAFSKVKKVKIKK